MTDQNTVEDAVPVSKKKGWIAAAAIGALALGGGGAVYAIDQSAKNSSEMLIQQAADDSAAFIEAVATFGDANVTYSKVLADAAGYQPKLDAVKQAASAAPNLFDATKTVEFSAAADEYVGLIPTVPDGTNAELIATDPVSVFGVPAPEGIVSAPSADELAVEYQGQNKDAAADAIQVGIQKYLESATALGVQTAAVTEARSKVDGALVALSASAVAKAPEVEATFAAATDAAKKAVADALTELRTVADGTFMSTPERMPTAVVHDYIKQVHNAVNSEKAAAAAAAGTGAPTQDGNTWIPGTGTTDEPWTDGEGNWYDAAGNWTHNDGSSENWGNTGGSSESGGGWNNAGGAGGDSGGYEGDGGWGSGSGDTGGSGGTGGGSYTPGCSPNAAACDAGSADAVCGAGNWTGMPGLGFYCKP